MFDDLILIGGISILALIAHGCRHQMWLQWVLRVIYFMFLLGECVWLLANMSDPGATSLSIWVTSFVALGTAAILFKPVRVLMSYVLTVVNQIVLFRPVLAAMGLLSAAPVLAPVQAGSSPEIAPAQQSVESPSEQSTFKPAQTVSDTPASSPEASSEPSGESAHADTTSESVTQGESGGASSSHLAAFEAKLAESEQSSQPPSESSSATGEPKATAESTTQIPALPSDAAQPVPAQPSPASPTSAAALTPVLAAGGSLTVAQSLVAERIFAPASIPHLNAAWVYITTFGFLLSRTDFEVGMQMPSMPFSMPVTVEQLLFYNGLGLVILAVCGVGLFVARKFPEVLVRLGLVKPTWTQVFIGLGMVFFTFFYDWAWANYTHAQTGMGYASKLTGYNEGTFKADGSAGSAFVLALAVGFFAGVGEETLIRGAVQPVFGALPAGILHGILHSQFEQAPIYILQVAGWSTIMGIVRRYTNTTTTIICHFTYNFLNTFLFAFNP